MTPYIRTFRGHKFYLDPVNLEAIDILDIVRALDALPRFVGHTSPAPYTVAQHSILCSQVVPAEVALEALLHDASEAYLNDLPSPVKVLCPGYQALEDTVQRAVAARFHLVYPWPKEVQEADLRLCATELRDLMPDHPEDLPDCEPYPEKIVPWWSSKERFLMRFRELRRG